MYFFRHLALFDFRGQSLGYAAQNPSNLAASSGSSSRTRAHALWGDFFLGLSLRGGIRGGFSFPPFSVRFPIVAHMPSVASARRLRAHVSSKLSGTVPPGVAGLALRGGRSSAQRWQVWRPEVAGLAAKGGRVGRYTWENATALERVKNITTKGFATYPLPQIDIPVRGDLSHAAREMWPPEFTLEVPHFFWHENGHTPVNKG